MAEYFSTRLCSRSVRGSGSGVAVGLVGDSDSVSVVSLFGVGSG